MSKDKSNNQIIMYTTADGRTSLRVALSPRENTCWLTQKQMAELFQTTTQNITLHIKNIYQENELEQISTCKEYLQVQIEGSRNVSRNTKFYNLDVILAVMLYSTTPRGFNIKAQGCAYSRYPGLGCEKMINPNGVAHHE